MEPLRPEQMRRVTALLNQLESVSKLRDAALEDMHLARGRWDASRSKYAAVHSKIVAEFGAAWAPEWIEQIHGPRPPQPPALL